MWDHQIQVLMMTKSKLANCSVCLIFFFTYLQESQIYSNKFFHNFHLSESSFSCPGLRKGWVSAKTANWSTVFRREDLQIIFCWKTFSVKTIVKITNFMADSKYIKQLSIKRWLMQFWKGTIREWFNLAQWFQMSPKRFSSDFLGQNLYGSIKFIVIFFHFPKGFYVKTICHLIFPIYTKTHTL
jgi:hypothetical protein